MTKANVDHFINQLAKTFTDPARQHVIIAPDDAVELFDIDPDLVFLFEYKGYLFLPVADQPRGRLMSTYIPLLS